MHVHKFNNSVYKPRILISPLGWGLGHATRCIPLIREFLGQGCDVYVAAEKNIQDLLIKEFPGINFLHINGYHIRYSAKKFYLPFFMIGQIPKIVWHIYKEHQRIKFYVKKFQIDSIISDNRFGCYHSRVPTVYMTHQLLVKTGHPLTEKWVQKIHYYFIKKYTNCWVPDFQGNENFAGELSHPGILPTNVKYIGGLSRFQFSTTFEKKYYLIIILSGPEPQRTLLEKILLKQIDSIQQKILFVRGLPNSSNNIPVSNSLVEIVNHLSAEKLNTAILQSNYVVCRSGYTSVMDLIKLRQKAILIPTPGQTEQEYLADYLYEKKYFISAKQKDFSLVEQLKKAVTFPFSFPNVNMDLYKQTVADWVKLLKNNQLL
jgi:uncharacterized protein (TIGR00661 family)